VTFGNGYTKADNWLWDYVMPRAKPNTFKIVAAVVRMTAGWHRDEAEISFDDFEQLTGMSRATVTAGVNEALKKGFLKRRACGRGHAYSTEIKPVDDSTSLESKLAGASTSSESKPLPVQNLNRYQFRNQTDNSLEIELNQSSPIKEIKRKGKERERKGGSPPPPLAPDRLALAEMVNALGEVSGMSPTMNFAALSAAAEDLLSCEYTAAQVAEYYGRESLDGRWNWYAQDWRGRRNDLPTPKQIKETIRGAIDWQPARASPGTNGHDPPGRHKRQLTRAEAALEASEQLEREWEISNGQGNEWNEWNDYTAEGGATIIFDP
jgi:phage replication O-like protein O